MTKLYDTPDTCQYIGPEADQQRLQPTCCAAAVQGKSYCAEHLWLVYQKGTALGKRKLDIKRANAIWDLESEFNLAIEEVLAEEGEL